MSKIFSFKYLAINYVSSIFICCIGIVLFLRSQDAPLVSRVIMAVGIIMNIIANIQFFVFIYGYIFNKKSE
jgi:hypothetical protein